MELARRRSERRRGKWQNVPGRRKIHGQRLQEEKKHTEQNLAVREAGSQLQWQVFRAQGEWPRGGSGEVLVFSPPLWGIIVRV